MKQHITPEQLTEISQKKINYLDSVFCKNDTFAFCLTSNCNLCGADNYMSIGQMIEFLGDDLSFIEWGYSPRGIKIVVQGEKKNGNEDELCDLLWEAVKEKLNTVVPTA